VNLSQISVRLVQPEEESRFRELMEKHHYLGHAHKVGETLWYVGLWQEHWVALLGFSSAALKCSARDNHIGWQARHQYDRLHLVTNNSRFLILPEFRYPNLGSRVLALCEKRIGHDWLRHFGHPLLLLETFVDTERFSGAVYKAANWRCVGQSQGYSRIPGGYSRTQSSKKWVFVRSLTRDAYQVLSRDILPTPYKNGKSRIMLTAPQMNALPDFFKDITDPRRAQGRRHSLITILAIAMGATLCEMRGYKAIAEWAKALSPAARERFGCRRIEGKLAVPSEYVIRNALIRVNPEELDRAIQKWNAVYGKEDESLAIDGKTLRNAIDEEGRKTHVMSVVGHQSGLCHTQKKSVNCR
jgi:hypothetical protein